MRKPTYTTRRDVEESIQKLRAMADAGYATKDEEETLRRAAVQLAAFLKKAL